MLHRKSRLVGTFIGLLGIFTAAHGGEEFATAKQAEAVVVKAVKHIQTAGSSTAYADFTEKKPGWVDRDLYVVVYDLNGKVLAHGFNQKLVGKEMIEVKDANGKAFIQERVDLAKSKGKFWQDYMFSDPVTKKLLPKSMYCEKLSDTAVCAGIYKRS
jgi:cytochrome c